MWQGEPDPEVPWPRASNGVGSVLHAVLWPRVEVTVGRRWAPITGIGMLLILFLLLRTDSVDYAQKDGRRDRAGLVGALAGLLLAGVGQVTSLLVVAPYLSRTPWGQWGAELAVLLVLAGGPVVLGSIILYASLEKMRNKD